MNVQAPITPAVRMRFELPQPVGVAPIKPDTGLVASEHG